LVEAKNVHGLVTKLGAIVPEYAPSKEILSFCTIDRHDKALSYRQARNGLLSEAASASDLDLAG